MCCVRVSLCSSTCVVSHQCLVIPLLRGSAKHKLWRWASWWQAITGQTAKKGQTRVIIHTETDTQSACVCVFMCVHVICVALPVCVCVWSVCVGCRQSEDCKVKTNSRTNSCLIPCWCCLNLVTISATSKTSVIPHAPIIALIADPPLPSYFQMSAP